MSTNPEDGNIYRSSEVTFGTLHVPTKGTFQLDHFGPSESRGAFVSLKFGSTSVILDPWQLFQLQNAIEQYRREHPETFTTVTL